ncbi:MAG TPA: protein kinase [Candidatus Polarisedimenticolia bacterium]|nr:protein kinase [Candidatus Polarisedimenticolia bacterium]
MPSDEVVWARLSPLLEECLALDGAERAAWLDRLRTSDAPLADELAALLAQQEVLQREGFLAGTVSPRSTAVSLVGLVVGDYTLRAPLGQGGMGSVWLADRSDGRFSGQAAIKLLNVSLIGREGEARFRREGNLLARLRHSHIAHLIDAGVSEQGQPYLVLEAVHGEAIDRSCDARALAVEDRVRLFLGVLVAVAHAHASLIVHRDLKPSNVLVTSDGQVKLLDFGVAKLLEAQGAGAMTAVTRDGRSMLTPEYASPEQLKGEEITTATDVYALGVLLYVLLSGRHPAAEAIRSAADLVRAVVEAEARPVSEAVFHGLAGEETAEAIAARRASTPRRLAGALRGDLDNIVAKALKKNPSERYASAEAMADDLRRYLDHEPVRARADSLGYRTRKFVSRNRLALGAAAVAVLALVAGTSVAVWEARSASRQRDRALAQLQLAEATSDLSSFLLSEATPSAGRPISNADLLARGEAMVDRRFADDPALRVQMLLTLADRYHENQQFDHWQRTLLRAEEITRTVKDAGLRARVTCARALSVSEKGDPQAALAMMDQALRTLDASPDRAADEAACRVYESITAKQKGDIPRAVAAGERALALEDGRPGPVGHQMEALSALTAAYGAAGRLTSADATSRRAIELLEAQGRGETRVAAIMLSNRSAELQDAGQYQAAVPLAERAVRIARDQDEENGASPSQLTTLATGLQIVGRPREALPLFDEAVEKARKAGSPARLVSALVGAASVRRDLGDLPASSRLLKEAGNAIVSSPGAAPQTRALLDRHLARQALAEGDTKKAVEMAQRAADEVATYGPPVVLSASLALAEAQNTDSRSGDARATAERCLQIAQGMLADLKHSYNVGRSHLELGVALAGLGDLPAGRDHLNQALEHLRACVGPDAPSTRRALQQLERVGKVDG